MENYFDTLGVSTNATDEDIKHQYRELVKIYHPDMGRTGDANKFHTIELAYKTLKDPVLRAKHLQQVQIQQIRIQAGQNPEDFLMTQEEKDLRDGTWGGFEKIK